MELPHLPSGATRWRLDFELPDPTFTAHVTLHSAARPGPIAEGVLFRLQAPAAEKLSVELPEQAAPGTVRLVTSMQGPSPLEARLTWVPLPAEIPHAAWRYEPKGSVRASAGTTTLFLPRPSGVVPTTLELDTATPTFSRRVHVLDVSTPASAPSSPRERSRA